MTTLRYRFEPMGSVAPTPLPKDELWLDVGNRAAPGVLDHHGGDTDVWSASELVLSQHEELIPEAIRSAPSVPVPLHWSLQAPEKR